jgi:hypothetical protein
MAKLLLVAAALLQPLAVAAQKTTMPFVHTAPVPDAAADDAAWAQAAWQPLQHSWQGPMPAASDCSGRYKVVASADGIHVLAEITDDTLVDNHYDPLVKYSDDDALHIYIDADASGGDHSASFQAFAYVLGIRESVVDIDTEKKPAHVTTHINYKTQHIGNVTTWEASIKVYPKDFVLYGPRQISLNLTPGQTIGFGVAYSDNDGKDIREGMIGSMSCGGDANRPTRNADAFTKVKLVGLLAQAGK